MQTSEVRLFSIGYVTKDKAEDSNYIRVVAIETVPELDGVIQDENVDIQFTCLDGLGNTISGKTTTSLAIPALWIGSDSQRMTAPDVKAGEIVYIYKVGDEEVYYWDSRNVRSNLRSTERVVYLFAAKEDGDGSYLDVENSYSLIFSSKDKKISIRMTDVAGEKSAWLFQMDGELGQSHWMDNKGQQIYIDSIKNSIKLVNKQQTSLHLDKENFKLYCKDSATFDVAKLFQVSCTNFKVEASKSFLIDSPDVMVKTSKCTVDSPITTVTGMLQAGPTTVASLSVAPPSATMRANMLRAGIVLGKSGSAICSIKGNCDIEGTFNFITGDLNMNGGNILGCGTITATLIDGSSYSNLP